MADSRRYDVIVVGGGIGGGAMATVLGRAGMEVLVLEREGRFVDRNKGENMMPWGAAEVASLGLADDLDAAGGLWNAGWHLYDEALTGSAMDIPLPGLPGVRPGSYTVAHPAARTGLLDSARRAGAEVCAGVDDVVVQPGVEPTVAYAVAGRRTTARARLVVAADGRNSATRHQLGIVLRRTPRTHVVSSIGVRDVDGIDDDVIVAVGDHKLMLVVPLGNAHARIYLVAAAPPARGGDATRSLLDATAFPWVPSPERWTRATPTTNPSTYGGEDSWVDDPRAPGVVLIGDAAGYNSPIIGQGLSLALRDVREVSEVVLSGEWSREAFGGYATRRFERMRRVRFFAQLNFEICGWTPEGRARTMLDPRRAALTSGMWLGYDDAPPELFDDEVADDLRRLACADEAVSTG